MIHTKSKATWEETINELVRKQQLRSHQCIVYNKHSHSAIVNNRCGCQRQIRYHSFDGPELMNKPNKKEWTVEKHTQLLESLYYGQILSAKVCENKITFLSILITLFEFIRYFDLVFTLFM